MYIKRQTIFILEHVDCVNAFAVISVTTEVLDSMRRQKHYHNMHCCLDYCHLTLGHILRIKPPTFDTWIFKSDKKRSLMITTANTIKMKQEMACVHNVHRNQTEMLYTPNSYQVPFLCYNNRQAEDEKLTEKSLFYPPWILQRHFFVVIFFLFAENSLPRYIIHS